MLFAISFLISFKLIRQIDGNVQNSNFSFEFTFQKGGNYSVNINGERNNSYFFLIEPIENISNYWIGKDKNHPCDNITSTDNLYIFQSQDEKAIFSGIIKKEGIYTIDFKKCSNSSSKDTVEIILMNPNSCLSLENQKPLKYYKFIISAVIILYILWFRSFSACNIVYLLFTLLFLFKIISISLYYNEYQKRNKSDEGHSNFFMNFQNMADIIYLFIILLNAFYFDALTGKKKKNCYIFSFVLSLITILTKFWLLFALCYIFIILCLIFYIFDFNTISSDLSDKSAKIYIVNHYLTLFYFTAFYKSRTFEFISYYDQFEIDIIDVIFCIIYGFIFRMKEDTKYRYFKISNFQNISTPVFTYPSDLAEIDSHAFQNNKKIKQVLFESDSILKTIGNFSFNFSSLESILIPSSVTRICSFAFQSCGHLKKIEFEKNSKLEIIEQQAFAFTQIEEITIPSSVSKIEDGMFTFCRHLKKVNFLDSSKLRIIEKNLFLCSSIEQFFIPSSVEEIKNYWCSNTERLSNVIISPDNQYFKYYEDKFIIGRKNLTVKNFDVLIFAPRNIKNVTIPSFIKEIASCAFGSCKYLQKVEFSNDSQLEVIGKQAFMQSALTTISIPSKVTRICKYAFSECQQLKSINFFDDSNLKVIENNTFTYCSIHSLVLKRHVTQIGEFAFGNCLTLQIIEVENKSVLDLISMSNCKFNFNANIIIMIVCE